MPIVDDENILHDAILSADFNHHFRKSFSGNIVDENDNFWYISQEYELANFVALMESNIGVPLGRILHNSAADSFEFILQPFSSNKFGFFAKKNRLRMLTKMWQVYGWGSFGVNGHAINSAVHPSVISGFYLAMLEFHYAARKKIQWRQLSDNLIVCELEDLDKSLSGIQTLSDMPWAIASSPVNHHSDRLLEKQDLGWSIDGKQSYVLPCDLINRLIFNAGGYVDNVKKSVDVLWQINGFDSRFVTSVKCVLQSCKELFLASDVYVFLNENNDWQAIIDRYLKPFGFGSLDFVESITDTDFFTVKLQPNAILAIGKLVGLWERANGKQAVSKVQLTDASFSIEIKSLLNYN